MTRMSSDADTSSDCQVGSGQLGAGGVPLAGEPDNAAFSADIRDIRDRIFRRRQEETYSIYVTGRKRFDGLS